MASLRRAFIGMSIVWVMLLPGAAFATSQPSTDASGWGYALAYGVYRVGSLICHQRPERSFMLFGVPLAVCARCTGVYVGAALTAFVMAVRGENRQAASATRMARFERAVVRRIPLVVAALGRRVRAMGPARAILVAAAIPSAATLVYEWSTGQMPAHWIRAMSGVALGSAVAWIVCGARPRAAEVM